MHCGTNRKQNTFFMSCYGEIINNDDKVLQTVKREVTMMSEFFFLFFFYRRRANSFGNSEKCFF